MSQVGVPLPGSVWSDYRDSTSLGADLFRLIGGSLTDMGKTKRKEDEAQKDRALRQTEIQRQADQFAATLKQRQLEHEDTVGRWDADRLAKQKDEDAPYVFDEATGRYMPQPGAASDTPDAPPTLGVASADDVARAGGMAAIAKSNARFMLRGSNPADAKPYDATRTAAAHRALGDTAAPAEPSSRAAPRPFLRGKDAAKANTVLEQAEDNAVSRERLNEQVKENQSRAALRDGNRKLFARLNPDLPPEIVDDLANADPVVADRFLTSHKEAKAKEAKAAQAIREEAAAATTAYAQIQGVAARAKKAGYEIDIPEFDMTPGSRPPAKEIIRLAQVVEKNYDDAFRAQMAALDRDIQSDTTLKADRRRFAQHQLDAYTTEIAAHKKVMKDLEDRVEAQESIQPGSSAGTPLASAAAAARNALVDLEERRNRSVSLIHSLIGIDAKGNLIEQKEPVAQAPAPVARPPLLEAAYKALPPEFPTKAAAMSWFIKHSMGMSAQERAALDKLVARRTKGP